MRELRISGVLGVVQEPSPAAGGGGVKFTFRYMVSSEPQEIALSGESIAFPSLSIQSISCYLTPVYMS